MWPSDAYPLRFDDHDAAAELVELVRAEKAAHELEDGDGILADRAQYDDAGVIAGWEVTDVAHTAVQGEHHPPLVGGRANDHRVLDATELFAQHRLNVVAVPGQLTGEVVRQVLVELDSHAGNGKTCSRANSAP